MNKIFLILLSLGFFCLQCYTLGIKISVLMVVGGVLLILRHFSKLRFSSQLFWVSYEQNFYLTEQFYYPKDQYY